MLLNTQYSVKTILGYRLVLGLAVRVTIRPTNYDYVATGVYYQSMLYLIHQLVWIISNDRAVIRYVCTFDVCRAHVYRCCS